MSDSKSTGGAPLDITGMNRLFYVLLVLLDASLLSGCAETSETGRTPTGEDASDSTAQPTPAMVAVTAGREGVLRIWP